VHEIRPGRAAELRLHVPPGLLFITAVPIIKLFARGEGYSGGHVL
jgi:hypothetical protein